MHVSTAGQVAANHGFMAATPFTHLRCKASTSARVPRSAMNLVAVVGQYYGIESVSDINVLEAERASMCLPRCIDILIIHRPRPRFSPPPCIVNFLHCFFLATV